MCISYRIPKPAVEFDPPVYLCRKTSKAFTLDGSIMKDFWADVPFTDDFIDIEGFTRPAPRYRTRVKMQWDEKNFYIAALLEGPEIWATVTERDEVIFNDNDFEIFIDPDSDTQQYLEFEMNAYNTVWDLLLTKAYRDNGKPINSFDIKGLKTCVHICGELNNPSYPNKYWSLEVVIPFESLLECTQTGKIPDEGEFYRVNFSRVQWLTDADGHTYKKTIDPAVGKPYPEDNWVWAPTGVINIHYPELWGYVFFTKTQDSGLSYSIPEDEKIKWELRKLYYAEHRYYDTHGRFTGILNELAETPHCYDVRIETTSHSFEISCDSHDGTNRIVIFSDGKTIACSR